MSATWRRLQEGNWRQFLVRAKKLRWREIVGLVVALVVLLQLLPNQTRANPQPRTEHTAAGPVDSGNRIDSTADVVGSPPGEKRASPPNKQRGPLKPPQLPDDSEAIESAFKFLYRQMGPLSDTPFPGHRDLRFIQSFVPVHECEYGGFKNAAYTYDQALVLLAFLARDSDEDIARARILADSLVTAQASDRDFADGRLRNGYASGKLLDGRGRTSIPYGPIPSRPKERGADQIAAGSDTGAMTWAALALVQAYSILKERVYKDPDRTLDYLEAAKSLGNWIVEHAADDAHPGFAAGMHGFLDRISQTQYRETNRPTRYNIDLAVLFDRLASVDSANARMWTTQARRARSFVDLMRNSDSSAPHYWIGTPDDSMFADQQTIVLDVQTSIVLQARQPSSDPKDPNRQALDWALKACTERNKSDSFDFNCKDGDGAWWEGTAKVALALHWLGRDEEAVPILARLRLAQLREMPAAGALPAASPVASGSSTASRCGVSTGLELVFRLPDGTIVSTQPWLIPDWPHIGATAWFIFAALGVNPYFVGEKPANR